MRTINHDEFNLEKETFMEKVKEGSVFIYPTDTIYGIGADASNGSAVKKIRELKKRYQRPFSVIAPSKEWIRQNCDVPRGAEKWLNMLPGAYTLIMKLKNKRAIAPETNNGMDTVGIRIPDHWFSKVVAELSKPIVTTSANRIGEDYMTSIEDLNIDVRNGVDFIIYEGEKHGKPSKIVDLTKGKAEIIAR